MKISGRAFSLPGFSGFYRGKLFEFMKQGERIYPIQKSIFLVDENWNALATGYVRDYQIFEGFVKGNYIIETFLNERESQVISSLFRRMYGED